MKKPKEHIDDEDNIKGHGKDRYQSGLGEEKYLKIKKIVKLIPNKHKSKAILLLKYIRKNNIKWGSNGEVIYKGQNIKKSNISTLILHAITKTKDKPHGLKIFYKALSKINIPSFLIINKIGKRMLTKKTESFHWRPPGRLYQNDGK